MDASQNAARSFYIHHKAVFAAAQAPGAGDSEQAALLNSWAAAEQMEGTATEMAWLKTLVFIERVSSAYSDDESGLDSQAAKIVHELSRPASLEMAAL